MTRHDKWLCMMYPRLKLLQKLLAGDGVIFVSINDIEVTYLRLIMDEIFGKTNFIAQLIWKSRQNKDNRNITNVSIDHEYVLCYGMKLRGCKRKEEQYKNPDNDPRGPWTSANMVGLATDVIPLKNGHIDIILHKPYFLGISHLNAKALILLLFQRIQHSQNSFRIHFKELPS